MRILIYTLVLFLSNQSSFACSVPPEHMYLSHDEAIDDAEWIARVVADSRVNGGMKMKVLEYIKGSGPEFIDIENASTKNALWHSKIAAEANYYGHTVSSFWKFGGRLFNEPDCKIHPTFLFSDHQYLIFGPLDYSVGFEQITSEDDYWLEYVKERVNGNLPTKPTEVSLASYLDNAKAVVRFQAKWENNRATWTETVLKGENESYANMLFPSPAAFFDIKLNPTCLSFGEPRKLWEIKEGVFDRIYVIEEIPTEEVKATQHLACAGADKNGEGGIQAWGVFSISGHSYFDVRGEFVLKLLGINGQQVENIPLNIFMSFLD